VNELTRDTRDSIIAQDLAEGLLPPQICSKRGFDDATVWRAVNRLRALIQQSIGQGMSMYRDRQLAELQDLRTVLEDPFIKADRKVELSLKIINLESELVGSKAPKRSVSASVTLDGKENLELIGMDCCPMCGGGLDPNGRPQPLSCVHEFMVSGPDGPRLATQKELDAPHQELYAPNSKQVHQLEEGDAQD